MTIFVIFVAFLIGCFIWALLKTLFGSGFSGLCFILILIVAATVPHPVKEWMIVGGLVLAIGLLVRSAKAIEQKEEAPPPPQTPTPGRYDPAFAPQPQVPVSEAQQWTQYALQNPAVKLSILERYDVGDGQFYAEKHMVMSGPVEQPAQPIRQAQAIWAPGITTCGPRMLNPPKKKNFWS
jgi:hypothetical protein